MTELPGILDTWQRLTGQRWSDLARACEVDWDTLRNWRKGSAMPWDRKATRLAAVVGPVVGRSDLLDVIARDRALIAKERVRPALSKPLYPTPRTLVIRPDHQPDGAA